MAYDTGNMVKQCLEVINKHKLIFIEEIIHYVPFSKPTFYEHKLNESDDIKTALDKNRVEIKNSLRAKWYMSDNPTTQIALYKLLSTDVELKKLAMEHIDHTTDGDKIIFQVEKFKPQNGKYDKT